MARVICDLAVHPHAAAVISGVKFERDRGEAISEEVPDETAALFASIPGFRLARQPAPEVRDMGLVEAASALHGMPWAHALAIPEAAPAPAPVPGDTNGDGKLSAAEKRARARAGA